MGSQRCRVRFRSRSNFGICKVLRSSRTRYLQEYQWLNRLQNRDRWFTLSFTTVGVGLRKSARPSASVYSNLLNRHRKYVKTAGFLQKKEVKRRYSVSVSAVKCWCRFRCRCQVSTVGLGSDRIPKIRSRFRL
jgi:hypothetical protein